jgi:hypothetical protein
MKGAYRPAGESVGRIQGLRFRCHADAFCQTLAWGVPEQRPVRLTGVSLPVSKAFGDIGYSGSIARKREITAGFVTQPGEVAAARSGRCRGREVLKTPG